MEVARSSEAESRLVERSTPPSFRSFDSRMLTMLGSYVQGWSYIRVRHSMFVSEPFMYFYLQKYTRAHLSSPFLRLHIPLIGTENCVRPQVPYHMRRTCRCVYRILRRDII